MAALKGGEVRSGLAKKCGGRPSLVTLPKVELLKQDVGAFGRIGGGELKSDLQEHDRPVVSR